jgi:hypothetical protein
MTLVLDRRQNVLDRLFILLSELYVPLLGGPNGPTSINPNNVVRNRNEVQADKLPGIILLDGDEVRDSRATLPPRGQEENAVPTEIMRMTPEIYVVLDARGIQNENVGEDLNTARLAILGVILPDRTLQSIVGGNGNITYDACVTDLARNRTMKGQLGISISFMYPLIGNEVSGIPSP